MSAIGRDRPATHARADAGHPSPSRADAAAGLDHRPTPIAAGSANDLVRRAIPEDDVPPTADRDEPSTGSGRGCATVTDASQSGEPETPDRGDDPGDDRRDDRGGRKAVTQEKILQASMELFAARGFDRTSISQIAARAGVSRATIFWHFGNKAALFHETCKHFLVPFRQSLEQSLVQLEPAARLTDQIAAYERFVADNRETIHAFVSWVFSSPEPADSLRRELLALHAAFVATIERALAELLDDPREASELATTLVSLLHGNMLLALGGAPGSGAERRERTVQDFLARALAGVPRRRL